MTNLQKFIFETVSATLRGCGKAGEDLATMFDLALAEVLGPVEEIEAYYGTPPPWAPVPVEERDTFARNDDEAPKA